MEDKNNVKMSFISLALLPFVMVIGNSMFIPILPNIEESLHITSVKAGLLLTVFSITAAIAIPLSSYYAEKLGKRRVTLVLLIFVAVGSLICSITLVIPASFFTYRLLIIGRILQGLGAGGLSPLAMSIIGELFIGETRSRALGATEVFNSFGKMISPFLGIVAVMITWEISFVIYLFVSIITFFSIAVFIRLDEKKKKMTIINYGQSVLLVVKQNYKQLLPIFYFSGVLLFCFYGLLVYLTYELEYVYGITGLMRGVVFFIPLGMMTISSYISGNIVGKSTSNLRYAMFTAYIFLFLPLIGGMLEHHFIFLLIIFATFSIGIGLMLPCCNYLVTSSVYKNERGITLSLYGMARFIGVATGPIVYSHWMVQEWWMFAYTLLLLIAGVLLMYNWWLWTENKKIGIKGL